MERGVPYRRVMNATAQSKPSIEWEIASMDGNVQERATVVDTLLKIIQKGAQAYREHTGEALDPSLIRAEEPI